jgi:hypothetical protein
MSAAKRCFVIPLAEHFNARPGRAAEGAIEAALSDAAPRVLILAMALLVRTADRSAGFPNLKQCLQAVAAVSGMPESAAGGETLSDFGALSEQFRTETNVAPVVVHKGAREWEAWRAFFLARGMTYQLDEMRDRNGWTVPCRDPMQFAAWEGLRASKRPVEATSYQRAAS